MRILHDAEPGYPPPRPRGDRLPPGGPGPAAGPRREDTGSNGAENEDARSRAAIGRLRGTVLFLEAMSR
ncbi:hypothetical protein A33M_4013 [Rhodovulum sp. PH10]|uniref:hypothetical protein n=1 Tax=Rhodovulum sp. PH10 TaxID=1187851 RepID=UPI00027C254E|nr:hypothetical protein [Rhodovulum sp. PH10]EJW10780.1 hypothetical protein A33M_4013 [Rhodovulum sp. PH10]